MEQNKLQSHIWCLIFLHMLAFSLGLAFKTHSSHLFPHNFLTTPSHHGSHLVENSVGETEQYT